MANEAKQERITGAMQECSERYRQLLHDRGIDHSAGDFAVDHARRASLFTWSNGNAVELKFRWHPERLHVARLLRMARKLDWAARNARELSPPFVDDEPRERSMSMADCGAVQ